MVFAINDDSRVELQGADVLHRLCVVFMGGCGTVRRRPLWISDTKGVRGITIWRQCLSPIKIFHHMIVSSLCAQCRFLLSFNPFGESVPASRWVSIVTKGMLCLFKTARVKRQSPADSSRSVRSKLSSFARNITMNCIVEVWTSAPLDREQANQGVAMFTVSKRDELLPNLPITTGTVRFRSNLDKLSPSPRIVSIKRYVNIRDTAPLLGKLEADRSLGIVGPGE